MPPRSCLRAHTRAHCAGSRWRGFSCRPAQSCPSSARPSRAPASARRGTASRSPPRNAAETPRSCRGRDDRSPREETKRHRNIGRPLQLAAGEHPRRIAVNQNAQQRLRMTRGRTRAAIDPAHPAHVEPIDHFADEPCQMPLRQPPVYPRGKQISRLPINRPEIGSRPEENQSAHSTSRNGARSRRNDTVQLRRCRETSESTGVRGYPGGVRRERGVRNFALSLFGGGGFPVSIGLSITAA